MRTQLHLKGSRTYLHSTDFYDWLVEDVCKADQYVSKLVFKKVITRQCDVVWVMPDAEISGLFQLTNPKTEDVVTGWLVETDDTAATSYDYDEDAVVKDAVVNTEESSITLAKSVDASLIEVIVALTKRLHNAEIPADSGKWLVGQLEFSQSLPITYSEVSVAVTRAIKNAFSISRIQVDGQTVGAIRFIVGETNARN